MNNWVSVQKDLPEYGALVWWHNTNGDVWLEAKKKSKYPLPKSITHWHPVVKPEPPTL